MSKFNITNTVKTTNACGGKAYKMLDPREELMVMALTSLWDTQFYGDFTGAIGVKAVDLINHGQKEFVAKLACYARNELNMRSISHVLAALVCFDGGDIVRPMLRKVCVRPDDILEIAALVLSVKDNRHIPNAFKRGVADVLNKQTLYGVRKYQAKGKAVTWKDLLRITHATPVDTKRAELFKAIVNDNVPAIETWETMLSANGNNAETWNRLIADDALPYMACLRNLRNMVNAGADIKPVLEKIADPEQVRNSRQFPYRFWSAYREVKDPAVRAALAAAFNASIANVPVLPGRTLIGVDVSGSMSCGVSTNSKISCKDIAELFGAMSGKVCADADVVYFSAPGSGWYGRGRGGADSLRGWTMRHYGAGANVLQTASEDHFVGSGGTDISLVIDAALADDGVPYDRIVIFTDDMTNFGMPDAQAKFDRYLKERNPSCWLHSVDLASAGTQTFKGKQVNYLAGWDDSMWSFMLQAERGFGKLVDTVADYQL